MSNRRFVIIHEVPASVKSVVEPFRNRLSELTSSHESLLFPVHITLRTGFIIPEESVDEALDRFVAHCRGLKQICVAADGYWFQEYGQEDDKKFLCGLKIIADHQLLNLHKSLLGFTEFQKGPQSPFFPHISLVYHDLTQNWYERLQCETELLMPNDKIKMSWNLDNIGVWEFDSHKWVCKRVQELKKYE